MRRFAALCAFFALAWSASAPARTLEVGQAKEFKSPSAAVAAAHDGDRIAISPGEYFDCAAIGQSNLTIEGVGDPAKVVMTDKTCEGKAILVTKGQNVTVRNLTLTRARVPDNNGAGIRDEANGLVVDHVLFVNNQNGILSGRQGGTMTVRDSLFDRNGSCIGGCAHGLYVGNLDLLRVERCHFVGTKQAHDLKSRALRTEVTDSTLEDGPEGTGSYKIDISNGGSLVARNNTLEKGPKAENHTAFIMVGEEGVTQPTKEFLVENNTARNDGDYQTLLVRNLTATEAILRGNKLTGAITPLLGDGQVSAAQ